MNYEVVLSERAEENLEMIAQYLQENWSNKAKMDFLIQISENLQLLEIMPYMNRKSDKQSDLRECIVNKQTVMYYKIKDNFVEIVTIQNIKVNPEILKF